MAISATIITYQDFRDRTISVWPPLLLLGGGLWLSAVAVGTGEAMRSLGMNIAFLLFQYLLLTLAFGLGKGQWRILGRQMGSGDALFLICAAAWFATLNFVLWYSLSLIVTLFGFLMLRRMMKEDATVPLAGGLSLCALVACTVLFILGKAPWHDLPIQPLLP